MIFLPPSLRRFAAVVVAAALTTSAWAQAPERNYSPADETAEQLPKFKTAMDAKNYAEASNIVNGLLAKVPADSYDAALLLQYRTQIFLQQGEFAKAIEPVERSLALSESKTPTYFEERVTRELYFFLFQLHFQEANQTKNPSLIAHHLNQAQKAIEHWLTITPQTTTDAQMYYAQLLIMKATQGEKSDPELLKKAIVEIDKGLLSTARPRDTFYLLKLVALQQLERNAEVAELLELLLKQKPDTASYWQQLAAIYVSLGNDVRSIVTFERAQAQGFLNTPKDNINLISIYFNSQQYEKAAELLERGLKNKQIDNDAKNWELLALCYQQLQRPLKGIEALKEGTKAFPDSGQLELQIAQNYMAIDKLEEALAHSQRAVAKGNLNKPHQGYMLVAYTAYQLKKLDVALQAATKATEYPEAGKDAANMKKALEDLIKDREAKKTKA